MIDGILPEDAMDVTTYLVLLDRAPAWILQSTDPEWVKHCYAIPQDLDYRVMVEPATGQQMFIVYDPSTPDGVLRPLLAREVDQDSENFCEHAAEAHRWAVILEWMQDGEKRMRAYGINAREGADPRLIHLVFDVETSNIPHVAFWWLSDRMRQAAEEVEASEEPAEPAEPGHAEQDCETCDSKDGCYTYIARRAAKAFLVPEVVFRLLRLRSTLPHPGLSPLERAVTFIGTTERALLQGTKFYNQADEPLLTLNDVIAAVDTEHKFSTTMDGEPSTYNMAGAFDEIGSLVELVRPLRLRYDDVEGPSWVSAYDLSLPDGAVAFTRVEEEAKAAPKFHAEVLKLILATERGLDPTQITFV